MLRICRNRKGIWFDSVDWEKMFKILKQANIKTGGKEII